MHLRVLMDVEMEEVMPAAVVVVAAAAIVSRF